MVVVVVGGGVAGVRGGQTSTRALQLSPSQRWSSVVATGVAAAATGRGSDVRDGNRPLGAVVVVRCMLGYLTVLLSKPEESRAVMNEWRAVPKRHNSPAPVPTSL